MDENNESAGTYGEIVRCWAEEREILGSVEKVGVRASRSNDADLPGI